MGTKMTVQTTGIEIEDSLYPVVPGTDDARVAGEVFTLVLTQALSLYRDLSTVLAECDERAPATVRHSARFTETVRDALTEWLNHWPTTTA